MPRPSMKAQRTQEIITAFKSCIAKYGLEGSSLEILAKESGLQRSLIRHFVGNRDDLIHLLAENMLKEFKERTDALYANLPENDRINALISLIFDKKQASSTEHILAFESLIAAGDRYPKIRTQLQNWLNQYTQRLSDEIATSYPKADKENCDAISFGITSLYFNLDSLSPLDLSKTYREQAKKSAYLLVSTLPTGE